MGVEATVTGTAVRVDSAVAATEGSLLTRPPPKKGGEKRKKRAGLSEAQPYAALPPSLCLPLFQRGDTAEFFQEVRAV